MPVQIRRATEDDVAAMCTISQRAHRLGYEHLIPTSHRMAFDARYDGSPKHRQILAARLRRALVRPGWTVLVAEQDGVVIGYTLRERTVYGAHKRGLFVDPDYQGAGIGNMLFAASLEGLDHRVVDLLVVEHNTRAIRLYEQHGFRSIGRSNALYFGAYQIRMRRPPVVE